QAPPRKQLVRRRLSFSVMGCRLTLSPPVRGRQELVRTLLARSPDTLTSEGLQACDAFFCGWMGTKQAHQPLPRKRINDKQMRGRWRTRRHGDALTPRLNLLQRTRQRQRIGTEVCSMFIGRELPRT